MGQMTHTQVSSQIKLSSTVAENDCTSVTKPPDVCEDGKVVVEENILIVRAFKEQIVFVWQMKRGRKHQQKIQSTGSTEAKSRAGEKEEKQLIYFKFG